MVLNTPSQNISGLDFESILAETGEKIQRLKIDLDTKGGNEYQVLDIQRSLNSIDDQIKLTHSVANLEQQYKARQLREEFEEIIKTQQSINELKDFVLTAKKSPTQELPVISLDDDYIYPDVVVDRISSAKVVEDLSDHGVTGLVKRLLFG